MDDVKKTASEWLGLRDYTHEVEIVQILSPHGMFPFRIAFAWGSGDGKEYVRAVVPVNDTTLSGIKYESMKITEGELYNVVELVLAQDTYWELATKQAHVLQDVTPKLGDTDRIYINQLDYRHAHVVCANLPEPDKSHARSYLIQNYLCPWYQDITTKEHKEALGEVLGDILWKMHMLGKDSYRYISSA
ncbi:hypothetical protein P154DRAFT_567608 [Amniculicola lignicola CBS 123094]|uniref:Uncharacterized protein n=1 Tax=Amniculicola lignicola CBS 123094 TaxID=1392246 RepID=A0A6A5W4D6_9PLEO|nr:hypothetical protein P154DRAFT_567608 [Amniculicola lignicola CBS 123094]